MSFQINIISIFELLNLHIIFLIDATQDRNVRKSKNTSYCECKVQNSKNKFLKLRILIIELQFLYNKTTLHLLSTGQDYT